MALKHNSKKVLDIIASQKERNAGKAYLEVHPNATAKTAIERASNLLAKPEAQLYLNEHIDKAKQTIVSLLDSDKDDIRLRASTDILDRSHGKAIQQIQQTTTGVQIVIDLSQAMPSPPTP